MLVNEEFFIAVLVFILQDLSGVYSARAFVGWYNGLPTHKDVSVS